MVRIGKVGAAFVFALLLPVVASAQATISGVVEGRVRRRASGRHGRSRPVPHSLKRSGRPSPDGTGQCDPGPPARDLLP